MDDLRESKAAFDAMHTSHDPWDAKSAFVRCFSRAGVAAMVADAAKEPPEVYVGCTVAAVEQAYIENVCRALNQGETSICFRLPLHQMEHYSRLKDTPECRQQVNRKLRGIFVHIDFPASAVLVDEVPPEVAHVLVRADWSEPSVSIVPIV